MTQAASHTSPETPEAQPSIAKRAVVASGWIAAQRPIAMALQMGRSLILTRLLFPEAFGLMALVSVVTHGLNMLSDVGVQAAIIRSDRDDEAFLQTAWTLQAIRGLLLALVCSVFAGPLAVTIGGPDMALYLEPLLPLASLGLLIGGFRSMNHIMANRNLDLGRITIMNACVGFATLFITVGFAWAGHGVLSIIYGNIANAIMSVSVEFFLLKGVSHRMRIEKAAAKEQLGLGGWLFFSTALTFGAGQIDRIILARLIDAATLGLYSVALVLAAQPKEISNRFAASVLFPAISEKKRESGGDFRSAFRRSRGALLAVSSLITSGVGIFGPTFFSVLYDERYAASGDLARWLCIPMWGAVLFGTKDRALITLGNGRLLAFSNAARLIGSAGGAYFGHQVAGLPGLIVGLVAGPLLGAVVVTLGLRKDRLMDLRNDIVLTSVTFAFAFVGSLAVWFAERSATAAGLDTLAVVALGALAGAMVLAIQVVAIIPASGSAPQVLGMLKKLGLPVGKLQRFFKA